MRAFRLLLLALTLAAGAACEGTGITDPGTGRAVGSAALTETEPPPDDDPGMGSGN